MSHSYYPLDVSERVIQEGYIPPDMECWFCNRTDCLVFHWGDNGHRQVWFHCPIHEEMYGGRYQKWNKTKVGTGQRQPLTVTCQVKHGR